MGSPKRTRVYLAVGATLALAFLLPPSINLKRFRNVLSESLSRSTGRQITVQNVHLRLLPLPGFTFRHLQISDDEEFGGEPILQTQEDDGRYSVASLRITSLWRGRLEVSTVSLTQASLNLVHMPDGHWNLERLINRAAQVPSAPTTKKKAEARPRFPYIELKDSRINFKFAEEKKPVSLSDAEFALWLAAENRWNVRLKAVPLRTDESISDTGVIRISGSFDRASEFSQTPFHFLVSWSRPQVDAITRIIRGHDPGWRGSVDLNAELQGTPADFLARLDASVDEFRRYDIARNSSFDLSLSCNQHFRSGQAVPVFTKEVAFNCKMPLGTGTLSSEGQLHFGSITPDFSVRIFASEVPVAALMQAALHAKSTLPSDLSGAGLVNGDWTIERNATGPTRWNGTLTASDVTLRANVLSAGLTFPKRIALNFLPAGTSVATARNARVSLSSEQIISRASLEPFTLDLGGDMQVSGSFDPRGYQVNVSGAVDWQRVLEAARALGLDPPATDLRGSGVLDAQYSGEWQHFQTAAISGRAQIRNARFSLHGVSEPVHLSGGTLKFDGPEFRAEKLQGSFPHAGLDFSGDLSGTRRCERHIVCDLEFALQIPELREKSLTALLSGASSGLTLPFFNSGKEFEAKWLLDIGGKGKVEAQDVVLGNLHARNLSAQLEMSGSKLLVRPISAELFGGTHHGEWSFDFSSRPAVVAATGSIRRAQVELVPASADGGFGSGLLDANYWLQMSGDSFNQLAKTATGGGAFSWRNGVLNTASSSDAAPQKLTFTRWTGQFSVEQQRVSLANSKMDSSSGPQQVSGQVSITRPWNLRFTRVNETPFVAAGAVANPASGSESNRLAEARR